jgi:hypothetical protein
MDRQIFSDGIGQITVVGGTVRLDFVAFSPTEKDAKGQPVAVFCQRIIMGAEGFLQSAGKIQETVEAMSKLGKRAQPAEASAESAEPAAAVPAAGPAVTPVKRPFP